MDYAKNSDEKRILLGARVYTLDPVVGVLACTVGVLIGYLLWGG